MVNRWRRRRPSWGFVRIPNGIVPAGRLGTPCRGHANGVFLRLDGGSVGKLVETRCVFCDGFGGRWGRFGPGDLGGVDVATNQYLSADALYNFCVR